MSNLNKLKLLEAKRDAIFAYINTMYEKSKRISAENTRSTESFLADIETIDETKAQFMAVLDEINLLNLELNPDFVPDFQKLMSLDEIIAHIKFKKSKVSETKFHDTPALDSPMKLPPLQIPSFDGSQENWPIFFETFKSTIHLNKQLSQSQKMQYLISKLSHSALYLTSGVLPTGENYNALWESLVKKYQDRRALGCYYLKNIFDIKTVNTASNLNAFIEKFSASVSALKQLGIDDLTDFILLHCALRKLDNQTSQIFEMTQREKEIPSYQDLVEFLKGQVKILDRINPSNTASTASVRSGQSNVNKNKTYKSFLTKSSENNCALCLKHDHQHLYECTKFKNMPVNDRFNLIKIKNGCINCLSFLHNTKNCKSSYNCKKCNKRHNSLLHFENNNVLKSRHASDSATSSAASVLESQNDINTNSINNNQDNTHPIASISLVSARNHSKCLPSSRILLSTAQVFAYRNSNEKSIIRCLIDNASQNHLLTITCCKELNLKISPLRNAVLKGVGNSSRPIKGYTNLVIQSRVNAQRYNIQALVVDEITNNLPVQYIDTANLFYLKNVQLADVDWNIPKPIDLVLGAELFPYLLLSGRITAPSPAPPLLETTLGYIIMGEMPVENSETDTSTLTLLSLNDGDLQNSLQKFWHLEEIPSRQFLSPEETTCEELYSASVSRDEAGRYSVALPFREDSKELGNSRNTAFRRLVALEKKFKLEQSLRENYNNVLNEYIEKGYLTEITATDISNEGYYIPHHAVTRPDKPMPRIVLDASAKTHTGKSLNDVLYAGPNLQANLFSLLIDFRLFPVAMTADIKQMYLQINTFQNDRKYLKILFRFSDHRNETIRVFHFNRLPFGLKSSPYLALRTIRQLASDMRFQYPDAAAVAESKLYMDDLVYSVPDDESAIRISRELISLFKSGSFDLIKWSSNSSALLNDLPQSHLSSIDFTDEHNNGTKVLGLSWEPVSDNFFLTTSHVQEACTKRSILSLVARVFDVLGIVAPVILYAKLLIKELWLCDIGWDDVPPESIIQSFTALTSEFHLLSTLRIPRHIGVSKDNTVHIVAFCDASTKGYGCVVYLHSTDLTGNVSVRLLCSKSKVAPTKIISLARLELCAALLMSKLIKTVRDIYSSRITISGTYAFSDATIALSWIHSSPHRWGVFVSNRVAQCQENVQPQDFYHIAGIENPSDCLSRGMLPSQLVAHDLWWNGPTWLRSIVSGWPIQPFLPTKYEALPEFKSTTLITARTVPCSFYELSQNVSRWDRLLRIIVYCLRFMKRLLRSPAIGVADLLAAENTVIRAVQNIHFAQEIADIKGGKGYSKRLKRLSPFMDEDGILRIEGRLSNSGLPFEAKHPALLPKHDHVVALIIDYYHQLHLHTGPGLLSSILRQRFWILSGRSVIRWRVRKCNKCFRVAPLHPTPKMADLPACRIQEAKAFTHTGVDYAGPLNITLQRKRGQRAQKAYICLFVCLTTKAVHIELASDLSSDIFLAAFKRFISRRGPVSCLYSDNGSNFIGAKAQLDNVYKFIMSSEYKNVLKGELLQRRICWKLIPPHSPHFGGIWESNIKCFKTHLYRVIGSQLLTYEELLTVLTQIEALLNSRPLCIMSEDPYPEALTPAHFLMSSPLQYLPASDIADDTRSLCTRKQLLDHLVQSYWRKWHLEYLHTLQVRQKWCSPDNPVTVGKIVLVGQDNAPPLSWPLGVITQTYPGSDSVVRVALVKTESGFFKRPVVKLYPLPTQ